MAIFFRSNDQQFEESRKFQSKIAAGDNWQRITIALGVSSAWARNGKITQLRLDLSYAPGTYTIRNLQLTTDIADLEKWANGNPLK
ncbi:hypothetical protein BH09SUM1_BH09SUM1_33190 [soil metagenome]